MSIQSSSSSNKSTRKQYEGGIRDREFNKILGDEELALIAMQNDMARAGQDGSFMDNMI